MSCVRLFKTEKDFENTFVNYLEDCKKKKKMPNVAGFAVFARIGRERFYEQKILYPETFELINAMLEDEAINSKCVSDALKIFYMKNKCGYKDRQEVTNELQINKVTELLSKIEEGAEDDETDVTETR